MTTTTTAASAPSESAASTAAIPRDDTLLAALDIGTNSVRMSLVRLDPERGAWDLLSQSKETVRLGQGEFASNHIAGEAIERGVLVLEKFAEIARGRGAAEIVAIATAALREAENRDEFVALARERAGVEVRVVPGIEEARLIYLGVVSGLELGDKRALFVDIGGGSTELIVGTQREHFVLESLKLGAIRLGNRFLTGITGPVTPTLYETIRLYARGVAAHAYRRIEGAGGFDMAVASSGTAMNLAAIAARRAGQDPATLRNYVLKASDLRDIATELCAMPLEERRKVPGLNPERADIIVSGAAVLHAIADDLNVEGFVISDRSLREGVLVDALLRRLAVADETGEGASVSALPFLPYEAGVRRRSVERLMRLNSDEDRHTRHVAHLTLRLFDETKAAGLHNYSTRERELLEYAALLHDIGVFVAHGGHHRHSYYIIRHAEMAGFTDEEVEIMANLAYFHRKSVPKKRHPHFNVLSGAAQQMVRRLSSLLRMAEGLDRSHLGLIHDLTMTSAEQGGEGLTLLLRPTEDADPRLELWYVDAERTIFEEMFGVPLKVIATPVSQ